MWKSKYNTIAIYVSAFFVIALILFALLRDTSEPITLHNAQKLLDSHTVTKVIATKEYIYLKTQKNFYKIASSQVSPKMFVDYQVEVENGYSPLFYILISVLVLGLGSYGIRWLLKNKNILHVSSLSSSSSQTAPISSNEPIQAIRPNISFDDIGGISEVKIELSEIIDFMKNPKRYRNFGARMPRGVLLVGPPGVGKTMIAKAVAHEADVPFFYQTRS